MIGSGIGPREKFENGQSRTSAEISTFYRAGLPDGFFSNQKSQFG
jgi:hypothetical protein